MPKLTPVPGAEPRYDDDGKEIIDIVTCGHCGRSWNDAAVSSWTPAPSGRCPFEYEHEYEEEDEMTDNGHNDLGYVYVVMPEMSGDEVYVFSTEEAANAFAESRGYEPNERVREEPILDAQFVRESIEAEA